MENETDLLEVENPDEALDLYQEEEGDSELTKAQEIAKNQRIRAERAEKELKALKAQGGGKKEEKEAPKDDNSLSPKDYLALTENRIGSDDFDEVVRLSKIMDKSIAETLKDKTAQLIIKNRIEERATAEATATKSTRQKSGQSTDERLLSDLNKGILPETEEGAAALAKAQFETLLKGAR